MTDHVRIDSDGMHTRVFYGDTDISNVVRSVEWSHNDPHIPPTCVVALRVIEATAIGWDPVWVGLETVPTSALKFELQTRLDRD